MKTKPNVLIADDHPIVRRGLRDILAECFPDLNFLEAENANETLQKAQNLKFSAFVLDINMPGRSGIEILSEIAIHQPGVPALLISAHSEEQYALRVMKAGAAGFISKSRAPREICDALKTVLEGRKYISPGVAQVLAQSVAGIRRAIPHEGLSQREFEVFKLLSLGKSLKEIAGDLSVSVQTVSTYRQRLLEKMGLQSNADLVRYATENQLF